MAMQKSSMQKSFHPVNILDRYIGLSFLCNTCKYNMAKESEGEQLKAKRAQLNGHHVTGT